MYWFFVLFEQAIPNETTVHKSLFIVFPVCLTGPLDMEVLISRPPVVPLLLRLFFSSFLTLV